MNTFTLAVLFPALLTSGAALAAHHTFSLGYAQSDVKNAKHIGGLHLRYRYEGDFPLSPIATFSWQEGSSSSAGGADKLNSLLGVNTTRSESDIKYYSLLAGPAWRINRWVSFYALAGIARTDFSGSTLLAFSGSRVERYRFSSQESAFAWGAGVDINPRDYLTFNLGYEAADATAGDRLRISGVNLGVGYRF